MNTPQLLKLTKLTRFFRFLRLLRVLKLKQLLYKLEDLIINETLIALINLLKVVLVVLFIGHWMACIFFYIGSFESDITSVTWIKALGMNDYSTEELYIAALYWAFTTMTTTGYGDIVPVTNIEKLFVMLCMLISCGVFAYVVGSIETILRRSSVIEEKYKEKILHVNQYLMHEQIPKPLRLQVRFYLQQLQAHKKREKMNQNEIINMLNKNLRDEVLIHLVGQIIRKQKFITSNFENRLQSEIVFIIKQQNYNVDDHIFEEGDLEDKQEDQQLTGIFE